MYPQSKSQSAVGHLVPVLYCRNIRVLLFKKSSFSFPYLAFSYTFAAQMVWQGLFIFSTNFPTTLYRGVTRKILTHVSRDASGPGTFEWHSTDWATAPRQKIYNIVGVLFVQLNRHFFFNQVKWNYLTTLKTDKTEKQKNFRSYNKMWKLKEILLTLK